MAATRSVQLQLLSRKYEVFPASVAATNRVSTQTQILAMDLDGEYTSKQHIKLFDTDKGYLAKEMRTQ